MEICSLLPGAFMLALSYLTKEQIGYGAVSGAGFHFRVIHIFVKCDFRIHADVPGISQHVVEGDFFNEHSAHCKSPGVDEGIVGL